MNESPNAAAKGSRARPPKTFLENPVDMGFFWHPPVFVEVAKTLLKDPQVDILIMYTLA